MLNIRTGSLLKSISPAIQKQFVPVPFLLKELQNNSNVMVVEIGKSPTTIFDRSIWAGNKAGGMSSWVTSLIPHLPYDKFYVYFDQDFLENKESVEYFNEYFDKLFYNKYLGFCIGSRSEINPNFLHKVSAITASDLPKKINSSSNIALVDVRTKEQIKKDPYENLPLHKKNIRYLNIPINC